MIILNKGEKADAMWGLWTEHITDDDIDALKQGKRLYAQIFDEYAITIKYKKSKKKTEENNHA